MKRIGVLAATIAATAGLTACGGGSPTQSQVSKAVQQYISKAVDSVPDCASLVGKVGDAWYKQLNDNGCKIGNDNIQGTASYDCSDGSSLIWAGSGPVYFGNSKGVFQEQPKDTSFDTSTPFGKAYAACDVN